jgi:hypothetical protein
MRGLISSGAVYYTFYIQEKMAIFLSFGAYRDLIDVYFGRGVLDPE